MDDTTQRLWREHARLTPAIIEQMPNHPRDAYWVRQGWLDAIQEIRNG